MIKFQSLPPKEAIEFFRQKGYKIGFDWQDVWQQEHQAAFTVAKAMQIDILQDIRQAVDAALVDGTTLDDFRKRLKPLLVEKGWWGKAEMTDPLTNETKLVQLGSTRRLKTIYDTNLRTAHSEGQWERIQDNKEAFPYLIYDGNNSEHPRLEHKAWDELTLPVDDPFWAAHMPVKAWGCKCRVRQASAKMLERRGLKVNQSPKVPAYTYNNKRTGEVQVIPKGVDPAFHYPPGGRQKNLQKMLDSKIDSLPETIKRAAKTDLLQYAEQKTLKAAAQWAMSNNLVDYADYGKIDLEFANQINLSLFEHLRDFPELRANQKFIGTGQGQYKRLHELDVEDFYQKLKLANPESDDKALRDYAKRRIKRYKISGNTYAHSISRGRVSGVAINEAWGSTPDRMKKALLKDVANQFHPVATTTVKSVFDHEFGHQLDTLLKLAEDSFIKAEFKAWLASDPIATLSKYGMNNIKEFIAESWAEFRNNADPRPVSRKIGEFILRMYDDVYNKK